MCDSDFGIGTTLSWEKGAFGVGGWLRGAFEGDFVVGEGCLRWVGVPLR